MVVHRVAVAVNAAAATVVATVAGVDVSAFTVFSAALTRATAAEPVPGGGISSTGNVPSLSGTATPTGRWLAPSVLGVWSGSSDIELDVELTEFATRLAERDPGISRTNRGGWHSGFLEHSTEGPVRRLIALIQRLALAYLAGLRGDAPQQGGDTRVQVVSLWANMHGDGDRNVEHQHAVPGQEGDFVPTISGVYYAAAEGRCAQLRVRTSGVAFGSGGRVSVHAEPGLVVLFPSTTLHDVVSAQINDELASSRGGGDTSGLPNCSTRVSFAFNLAVRQLPTSLLAAASTGDIEEIKRLSASSGGGGEAATQVAPDGFTAAHHAAEMGHAAVVDTLAASSADLSQASRGGTKPLVLAAVGGHTLVVKRLLQSGVETHDVEVSSDFAASAGHLPVLKVLTGALGEVLPARATAALHTAVRNGHLQVAAWLLDQRVDPNAEDSSFSRPLSEAARGGLVAMTKLLLHHRANLVAADREGYTPIFRAAEGGHVQLMSLLAGLLPGGEETVASSQSSGNTGGNKLGEQLSGRGEAKASYLAAAMLAGGGELKVGPGEASLLHVATREGHSGVAKWLLERRSDLHVTAEGSRVQPLHLAAHEGHTDMVRQLLAARANVRAVARGDLYPLHFAALGGHEDAASALLAGRASVGNAASDGSQPLHLAVSRGGREAFGLVERLLTARASVTAKTKRGEQPLHRAVGSQDMPSGAIELLLDWRADPMATSLDGSTPAHLAAAAGNSVAATMLHQHRQRPHATGENVRASDGSTTAKPAAANRAKVSSPRSREL